VDVALWRGCPAMNGPVVAKESVTPSLATASQFASVASADGPRMPRAGTAVDLVADIQKREDGTGYLGVQPAIDHKDLGALGAFGYAGRTTVSMGSLIFKGIGMMFTGQVPVTGSQGLAGPVGIIQLSSEAVQGGYYLMLLALISINLAILNMLPLLPLDGGHVLFSIIERVRGRSLSLRVFERISMVGFALFLLLFIVATSNDIGRVFGG
jgi:regulator of sigma E protease